MNKKFDIVEAILEKFDYQPCGKERKQAEKELDDAIAKLLQSLNYNQEKLFRIVEDKQILVLVEHEKEVANYIIDCLRSIFSELK